jgi:hypothetical protein
MNSEELMLPAPHSLTPVENLLSVKQSGARGDGESDDREAIQRALDFGSRAVFVPPGNYRLGGTLRVPSGCWLRAHPNARFFLSSEAGIDSETFLISNSDTAGGNAEIRIEGGIWDGNNRHNPRGKDAPDAYTGVSMNFIRVQGLEVSRMRLIDAETYFIRLSHVENFRFANIQFSTTKSRPNQDGIHIAGHCHNGSIFDISGVGQNGTRDDLVAMVADDALERVQNIGLSCGPISGVRVNKLRAEDCHSFVRLGSVFSTIEDIDVEDVKGGCEACAINMDALRYCAVPLFVDGDGQFPEGAGDCRNILMRDFSVYRSKPHLNNPLLLLETRLHNFRLERFQRDFERDANLNIPTLRLANFHAPHVVFAGLPEGSGMQMIAGRPKTRVYCMPEEFKGHPEIWVETSLTYDKPMIYHGKSFDMLEVSWERGLTI